MRTKDGVHQSAGAHHDTPHLELARDRLEQHTVQAMADQLPAKPDEGRPLRRRLVGSKAAEPAEAVTIVQRPPPPFSSERSCQVASSMARNRARGGPPVLALHRGRSAQYKAVDLGPVEQRGKFRQRRRRPRLRTRDEVLLRRPLAPIFRALRRRFSGTQPANVGDAKLAATAYHASGSLRARLRRGGDRDRRPARATSARR